MARLEAGAALLTCTYADRSCAAAAADAMAGLLTNHSGSSAGGRDALRRHDTAAPIANMATQV